MLQGAFIAVIVASLITLPGKALDALDNWRAKPLLLAAKSAKIAGYSAFVDGKTAEGHAYYTQAATVYAMLAAAGINEALFELGKLTCVGWGVKRDPQLANFYFKRATLTHFQHERLLQIDEFKRCWMLDSAAVRAT